MLDARDRIPTTEAVRAGGGSDRALDSRGDRRDSRSNAPPRPEGRVLHQLVHLTQVTHVSDARAGKFSMRARVPRSSILWLSLLATARCGSEVGTDLNQIASENPFPDGGLDAGTPIAVQGDGGPDPFLGAPAYAAQTGPTTHNPGLSCIQSGCHAISGGTNGAPNFVLGGTVYEDYVGKTAASGVEIRVVDSVGNAVSVYSGPAGTFYLGPAGDGGVVFPIAVGARNATSTRPMITTVTSALGSCDQATCHVPGGGPMTSTGNYYPIHVP